MSESSGTVYLLRNQSYPGLIKIGCTNDMSLRLSCLNTSHIHDFQVIKLYPCSIYFEFERIVHKLLLEFRVRSDREFFKIEECRCVAIIDDAKVIFDSICETLLKNHKKSLNRPKVKFQTTESKYLTLRESIINGDILPSVRKIKSLLSCGQREADKFLHSLAREGLIKKSGKRWVLDNANTRLTHNESTV